MLMMMILCRSSDSPSTPESNDDVNDLTDSTREIGIVCEYDFCWDKRGSGFTYDSKSGELFCICYSEIQHCLIHFRTLCCDCISHNIVVFLAGRGSVIGYRSKKLLAYEVKSSACKKCALGWKIEEHDCRKNHEGSAKSIEPSAAVDLLAVNPHFQKAGVRCDVLVGDEDAATYCHVQQRTVHDVKKWIDRNHSTKKFSNKLYSAAKKHKFLNSKVIKYLKMCFCYAIAQNKDNVDGLIAALRNIVPHTFGVLTGCADWCKARGDPNYVYR